MVVANRAFVFSLMVGRGQPCGAAQNPLDLFGDVSHTLGVPSFSPYRPWPLIPHPSFNAGKIARISSRVGRRIEWTCTVRAASRIVTLKLSFSCLPINP